MIGRYLYTILSFENLKFCFKEKLDYDKTCDFKIALRRLQTLIAALRYCAKCT